MKTNSSFAAIAAALIMAWVGYLQPVAAAYLESGSERTGELRPPERPADIRPVPRPVPAENPVLRLVRAVDVGSSYSHGGLVVFPLIMRGAGGGEEIRTLDEALSHDWITVRELDNAQVSELLVRNESRRYVFLMSGEIIAGGRQDRIIRHDVLLVPRSDFVRVPVYCGEKERWTGERESFKSSKYMADQGLRSMASESASQSAIWSRIDDQIRRADVNAPTRNYQEIYRDKEVGARIDDRVGHFRQVPGRRTVGAVIVSNGRIVSCDLFGDPELFARLWDKICRAQALECVLRGDAHEGKRVWPDPPGEGGVRRFLDRALSADVSHGYTPGAGEALRISGSVAGSALVWRDRVVHAALFPSGSIEPFPLRGGLWRGGEE